MSGFLEVDNLSTQFSTEHGTVTAVDQVSFRLEKGKTLGIVGESGCGKSVTSLSILRLIQNPGKISSGSIHFKGQNLFDLSETEMRKIRGNRIAMIFQEPMTSLNPVYTCGEQILEAIRLHRPKLSRHEQRALAVEYLKKVGIPEAERRFDEYPHQLSGGMRQRVMIAMAICCEPELLIADEPTTALDVTIQAQILDLLRNLQKATNSGMILITHDLGVVAEMCSDVAVMYAGRIVEYGSVYDIFERPSHPYTKGLLDSIPHFESGKRLARLNTISGTVPSLMHLPKGCRFQDRCTKAQDKCRQAEPVLSATSNHPQSSHKSACFFPYNQGSQGPL